MAGEGGATVVTRLWEIPRQTQLEGVERLQNSASRCRIIAWPGSGTRSRVSNVGTGAPTVVRARGVPSRLCSATVAPGSAVVDADTGRRSQWHPLGRGPLSVLYPLGWGGSFRRGRERHQGTVGSGGSGADTYIRDGWCRFAKSRVIWCHESRHAWQLGALGRRAADGRGKAVRCSPKK